MLVSSELLELQPVPQLCVTDVFVCSWCKCAAAAVKSSLFVILRAAQCSAPPSHNNWITFCWINIHYFRDISASGWCSSALSFIRAIACYIGCRLCLFNVLHQHNCANSSQAESEARSPESRAWPRSPCPQSRSSILCQWSSSRKCRSLTSQTSGLALLARSFQKKLSRLELNWNQLPSSCGRTNRS